MQRNHETLIHELNDELIKLEVIGTGYLPWLYDYYLIDLSDETKVKKIHKIFSDLLRLYKTPEAKALLDAKIFEPNDLKSWYSHWRSFDHIHKELEILLLLYKDAKPLMDQNYLKPDLRHLENGYEFTSLYSAYRFRGECDVVDFIDSEYKTLAASQGPEKIKFEAEQQNIRNNSYRFFFKFRDLIKSGESIFGRYRLFASNEHQDELSANFRENDESRSHRFYKNSYSR